MPSAGGDRPRRGGDDDLVAQSHKVGSVAPALLECVLAVLHVAVRTDEEPLADLALERQLTVAPALELGGLERRFAPAP